MKQGEGPTLEFMRNPIMTESRAAPLVESIRHEYEDSTLKFLFNPIRKSLRMN